MPLTLGYYFKRVQREAGYVNSVSGSFPSDPNSQEQRVLDAINDTLQELNTEYWQTFQQTSVDITTIANQASYNLSLPPYNQPFYDVTRLARNGVIRKLDGLPLQYIDYTQYDQLRPTISGVGLISYFTGYGKNLIIYPNPDGNQLTVRYYGLHVGTDTTGTIQKARLDTETDITMLDDQWERVLVYGAACKVYLIHDTGGKYKELEQLYEKAKLTLIGMTQQAGEDAGPRIIMANDWDAATTLRNRYFPFGTEYQ